MTTPTDQINKILDQMRPSIQMDGGDVALKSVKNGLVTLKIKAPVSVVRWRA